MRRAGFTLLELIVATVIAGIVAASLLMTFRRQERFYGSATEMMGVRSQLRDAADVLITDIRGATVSRYGFPLMTDTAVEMFASIGTSVVCSPPSGRTLYLSKSALLTSFLASPDTGDIALLFADSTRWIESRITSFAVRSLAPTCGYTVTLPIAVDSAIHQGSPIHFVRRGRYSIYRSSDGEWYLGYRRCNALGQSVCATIQPVSGPYLPYSKNGASGLGFRYFDQNGAELVDAAMSSRVARVDVVVRGETRRPIALAGDAVRRYRDSVVISISPRNRVR
jgi:prepilin-type N-terminal cleavage/methylation domain-containing protein